MVKTDRQTLTTYTSCITCARDYFMRCYFRIWIIKNYFVWQKKVNLSRISSREKKKKKKEKNRPQQNIPTPLELCSMCPWIGSCQTRQQMNLNTNRNVCIYANIKKFRVFFSTYRANLQYRLYYCHDLIPLHW